MPSTYDIRRNAVEQETITLFNATSIVGSAAQSGTGTVYAIDRWSSFDFVTTVASYANSGNIVGSVQPCSDSSGTDAANHATTSGNISSNGSTYKQLGAVNAPYARGKYTIASTASATLTMKLYCKA